MHDRTVLKFFPEAALTDMIAHCRKFAEDRAVHALATGSSLAHYHYLDEAADAILAADTAQSELDLRGNAAA